MLEFGDSIYNTVFVQREINWWHLREVMRYKFCYIKNMIDVGRAGVSIPSSVRNRCSSLPTMKELCTHMKGRLHIFARDGKCFMVVKCSWFTERKHTAKSCISLESGPISEESRIWLGIESICKVMKREMMNMTGYIVLNILKWKIKLKSAGQGIRDQILRQRRKDNKRWATHTRGALWAVIRWQRLIHLWYILFKMMNDQYCSSGHHGGRDELMGREVYRIT